MWGDGVVDELGMHVWSPDEWDAQCENNDPADPDYDWG